LLRLKFKKEIFVKSGFIVYYKSLKSGRISGIRPLPDIRPDIRYPASTGYPAGYSVSDFSELAGYGLVPYTANSVPVSDASLIITNIVCTVQKGL
jgi:hypothetical protein